MNHLLQKYRYFLLSSLIFITAIVFRLYNLGDTSLWLDEAIYANNSYAQFVDFLYNTRNKNSSPIFLPFVYWLLGDFVRDSFLVRFIPMLFSSLSVLVMLQLHRVGLPKKVVLISAFWLAISPVKIQYAQEVREYSLSVLVTCLLIYGFFKSLNIKKSQDFYFFLAILIFTPFASYGNLFIASILLAYLLIADLYNKQFS